MKVGIMGGTFNPVHNGHLALAQAAYQQYNLDTVWFMPSGLPAHKNNTELLPANIRLHLVELALEKFPTFKVSSFETDRPGFTYTADTLQALSEAFPDTEFYFIIGGDSLMKFHHWVKPDVISSHATLLAALRNGVSKDKFIEQSELLKEQFGTKVYFIEMAEWLVSSQEIRSFCNVRDYSKIEKMVPEAVLHYITEHELWKCPTN